MLIYLIVQISLLNLVFFGVWVYFGYGASSSLLLMEIAFLFTH